MMKLNTLYIKHKYIKCEYNKILIVIWILKHVRRDSFFGTLS